jgi:4-carboxymuconolactone decarboxylase
VGIARAYDFIQATNDVLTERGCEPQVKGHVAANLNVGNDRARMADVVTQLLPFIGYPRTLTGLRIVNEGTAA